ncbi:MAG: hypothetical protein SW833_21955 [Cyanobacteriota bacterium]|nr:hypothetical protein [Cyanobacteriota bacterium]
MTIAQKTSNSLIKNTWYSLIRFLNGRWHKVAMQLFMLVIFSHLAEHLAQIFQLWVLGWKRPECLGFLGLVYPWIMKSEWLHYGHALFMLLGLALLRPAITGRARVWWNAAFILQFWHHLEHILLLGQVLIRDNLYRFAAPTSIAQVIVQQLNHQPLAGQPVLPRIELHLFYNLIVLIPMVVALCYHRFPSARQTSST